MLRHPTKHQLFDYAERLVDGRAAVSVKTAAHVGACNLCAAELDAMHRSLAFAAAAPDLEPSVSSNIDIMLAARGARRAVERRRNCRRSFVMLAKGLTCAAGLLLTMAVSFGAALHDGSATVHARSPKPATYQRVALAMPSPEAIQKTTAEIQTLAAAVNGQTKKPHSLWERERLRVVQALNDDIAEVRAALEQNPGCRRAALLIHGNLERQAQTLRSLYTGRDL
ncbi:MAG TPA: hypothetical protein HPP83_02445 [Candidatus Hydrogenedentes bacterium]|nr:hypothetical protein [Candidatus Hydrogenedentota bacterium]